MIKKLQRKFILIAMISVFVVLFSIMTAVNVVNYRKISDDTDIIIKMLAEHDGKFPKPDNIDHFKMDNDDKPMLMDDDKRFTKETPYETRFFSAYVVDEDIQWSNTGNVAALDSDEANTYVKNIILSGKKRGYKDNYRYYVTDYKEGKLVVCVDCTKQLSTASSFLKGSALISAAGLVAIFVLVLFFSQKAIKPIADSYEKQKRFITDSSHELKTPLAVIMANTEVIEMTDGENEWTKSIRNQIERMTLLTKNLTALAKMDESGVKINKTEFSLSDTVEAVSHEYKILAESRGLQYNENIEKNIEYNGEEQSIKNLVNIILDNACKYSNGIVKISLKKCKGKAAIEIYNTADNVSKGDKSRFFDRFYRADESRSKEIEGFGIGLSIAKSIVELHNGKITAESKDGKSIVVRIVL